MPVGVVGFRGYSGAEADPHSLQSSALRTCAAGTSRRFRRRCRPAQKIRLSGAPPATAESVSAEGLKAVLLATPARSLHGTRAPKFLDAGAIVVDLSGAFRLRTPERYKQWYKEEHTAPDAASPRRLTDCPNIYRDRVRKARLDLESRLLSHGGEPRHPSAGRSGHRRPQSRHRLRRQERRERRGPQAFAQHQLLRSDGEFLGILDPEASACAGGAAHQRPRRIGIQLHRAVDARSTAAFSKRSTSAWRSR